MTAASNENVAKPLHYTVIYLGHGFVILFDAFDVYIGFRRPLDSRSGPGAFTEATNL